MIKHFVELVSEEGDFTVYRVKECAKEDFDWENDIPEGTNAIRFFDEDDAETSEEDESKHEPITYFGEEYTIEEMRKKFPGEEDVATEYEKSGYKRVVLTQDGNSWYGLRENDTVITK